MPGIRDVAIARNCDLARMSFYGKGIRKRTYRSNPKFLASFSRVNTNKRYFPVPYAMLELKITIRM